MRHMPSTSTQSLVTATYARALLELAAAQNQADAIASELADLRTIIQADTLLAAFLRDPSIRLPERTAVLDRAVRGKVSPLLWAFLGVMNLKNRLGYLADVEPAYRAMLDHMKGRIAVRVTVAQAMDDALLTEVRQRIGDALKKDPVITQRVDESVLGGMIVRVDDRLVDASVRKQLELMKGKLLEAGAK
jgi:F-type H+-transporting ATPase subunit delta